MNDQFGAIAYPLKLGGGRSTVLVKDCIDIAGFPTCQGSGTLAEIAPATANADVVDRLLSSGTWTITGKANMHEFAYGVTGVNGWAGTPVNPRFPERIAGGSSSGSAVGVAAELADAAIGTDTGGSVRMPAACCGVVGFKPSSGRVSKRGTYPAESSLDCVGAFARNVDGVEAVMTAIAPDWTMRTVAPPRSIGRVNATCSEAVDHTLGLYLAALPVVPTPCDLPLMSAAFDAGITIMAAETWRAIGHLADHRAMGEDVRGRVKAGALVTAKDVTEAEHVRIRFAAAVDALLAVHDMLVLPTLPDIPPTLEEAKDARKCVSLTRLVRPFNLSGHPAITLPLTAHDGLPVGLQIVGRRGEDETLIAMARWVEAQAQKS